MRFRSRLLGENQDQRDDHHHEREFGPTAAIDYDGVVLRWMDHYVKGMDNGVDQEKPVRYFVMGRNEWRESDRWPPAAVETPMFFVPSAGGVSSGRLQAAQFEHKESFSQFVSDPANPVANSYDSSGAHDYARLSERADVLHSILCAEAGHRSDWSDQRAHLGFL
jgi:putative CocE/NonD family hydrolase